MFNCLSFLPEPIEHCAEILAQRATKALITEARLSPKPGLVDSRSNGVHQDMSLALMERSAYSLQPIFKKLAQLCWLRPLDNALRQQVGVLGRKAEEVMMQATGGVNTHRGAIWTLGLLVSACASLGQDAKNSITAITSQAAKLAKLPDANAPKSFSKGQRASQRYQVPGAREEAQQGFPHITQQALPQLRRSRAAGANETAAQLDALMAIMSTLSDTCVLSRAGWFGLKTMQYGAKAVLSAGGVMTQAGLAALIQLDHQMRMLNASPGGSADLLAAALWLDDITQLMEQ